MDNHMADRAHKRLISTLLYERVNFFSGSVLLFTWFSASYFAVIHVDSLKYSLSEPLALLQPQ